jgi:hypothetical protein
LIETEEHVPQVHPIAEVLVPLLDAVGAAYKAEGDVTAFVTRAPSDPLVQQVIRLDPAAGAMAQGVVEALRKLDDWDFNVFELEKASGNNALLCTTYAVLMRLGLLDACNLNAATLRTFLLNVQAGYHPNPYHNATHAADVTHINYYIITKGGLAEKCKLSKEELLAAALAAAIHDFDHPGFNNNFHTRTNAYLSTLYNDRSVLENHHVASVYEMVRTPEYNVFAPLTDDQRREVRDTMIEMVLSTDMGLHQKIYTSFYQRQRQGSDDWTGKEDHRLALSMSIKMADVSNCGRPSHLYSRWAKNIANEFYGQGDAETHLHLSVSPFMDRRKDAEEFTKGQISFMNFVVIPMFTSLAETFPTLKFCVDHCIQNREHWQRHDGVLTVW